jgi:hypothetical protein
VVATGGRDEAELVACALIEDQGREAGERRALVVQHFEIGPLEAEIGAAGGDATVPGKAIGMAAQGQVLVGLVSAAVGGRELAEAVALEAVARDHVEDAIAAVAVLRRITAALHFEILHVLGIELCAHARQVAVGNRHAIDLPCHTMPAARMQMVVHDVGSGHIVGDHRHAASAVLVGRVGDLHPRGEAFGGRRLGMDRVLHGADADGFADALHTEFEHDGSEGVRVDADLLHTLAGQTVGCGGDQVTADRNGLDEYATVGIGDRRSRPCRCLVAQHHRGLRHCQALRVPHRHTHGAEERGQHRHRAGQRDRTNGNPSQHDLPVATVII